MPILHQYPVSIRNPTTVLAWCRAISKFPLVSKATEVSLADSNETANL